MTVTRLGVLATVLVLLSAGCHRSPTSPGDTSGPRLTIAGDRVVTLSTGDSIRLGVEERDGSGHLLSNGPQVYSWASSQPSAVEVSADGVLHTASGLGASRITARAASGLSDSIDVWVQPPASTPSTFHITLVFAPSVPDSWRIALAAAAARWESAIRAELPAVAAVPAPRVCSPIQGEPLPTIEGIERGVRISVEMSSGFGPDSSDTEAVGGPCQQRGLPFPTTVYGRITINRAITPERAGTARGQYVALHEMGHVLGLVGVVQGITVPWYDFATHVYTGVMAREGYRRMSGGFPPSIAPVTSGHWPFPADVMGSAPFIVAITPLSIGGLMDLGYPAAWYGGQ